MQYDVSAYDHKALNELLREQSGECHITGCLGQRFIAAGMSGKTIVIDGIPGNALGAYLNGAELIVHGNAQDAVGDTMNDGLIAVNGNIGDAAGYAMRGGKIFVKGDAGYRAGIHMKEYKEKIPVMIIGGRAGSFLGEYQAGGVIVVLGMTNDSRGMLGNFPCTGMHGGRMYLRGDCKDVRFPSGVCVKPAGSGDMRLIENDLREFCGLFGFNLSSVLDSPFTLVTPDSKNPYKQMYAAN